MTSVIARDREVAEETRLRRGECVHGLVDQPQIGQPRHHLASAVTARQPGATAHREIDLTIGGQELLRDLASRLAASEYEDRPGRKLGGTAVFAAVEMRHVRG